MGSKAVQSYIAEFPEYVTDGGKIPQAYAIFSTGDTSGDGSGSLNGYYNHTGVVMGINTEKDEIYIAEASSANGYTTGDYPWPYVRIKKLSEWTNAGPGGPTYAYTAHSIKGL